MVFTDAGFSRVISKFRLSASRGGGRGCAHTRLIYVNWRWRWRCTRACVCVCIRCRLYLCTHRPTAVGRASFVECGLILMGTDDKQRKQASSLPGEICLLLPRVQWDLCATRVRVYTFAVVEWSIPCRRRWRGGGGGGWLRRRHKDVDLFRSTRGAEERTAWRRRAQGARYIGKNYLFRSDKYFRTTRNRRILNGERRIYFQIWIDGKEIMDHRSFIRFL